MSTKVNWTRPATLAMTLVALGGAAAWLEYKYKPQKEAKEEASKKVFPLKDMQTSEVRLVDGSKAFAFKCVDLDKKLCKPGDNSKWEMTAPGSHKADAGNVNALLSSMNNLATKETIDLTEEPAEKRSTLLKEYRLDPESRSSDARLVEVTDAGGEKTVAWLGDAHPMGDGIFAIVAKGKGEVKPDETKVYVVPTYFKNQFDHDLGYWRDKKLFSIGAADAQGFTLSGTKGQKISGKKEAGQWRLKSGAEDLTGDIENVDNLISAATFLSAKKFVSDDRKSPEAQAALKGSKPALTLEIESKDGPVTLALFQKGTPTQLLATVSNLDGLYELEPSALGRVNKDIKDLRLLKLITSMERFNAKKLEFSGKALSGATIVLVNEDNQWKREGGKGEIDNGKVQGALDSLSGNRVQDVLDLAKAPKGEADGLKLVMTTDKGARNLVFWKADGGALYARDLDSPRKEAFSLDPAIAASLPWSAEHFKKSEKKPEAKPVEEKKAVDDGHGHGDGHAH